MIKIYADELKKIELKLLCEFHKICNGIGINYSLAYGTLLGAARHKGFIPWDDDIDVCMFRNDYEKFIDYCKSNETSFILIDYRTCDWYNYPMAKLCAKGTVIEEEGTYNDGKLGVYIDIFPIDSLGNTREEAIKEYRKTELIRDLIVAANWKKYFRSKTNSIIYEPVRIAFYIFSRFVSPKKLIKKLEKSSEKRNFEGVKYSGNLFSAYREREISDSYIFDEMADITFEGITFKCFKQYDKYLSGIYGDYMKLPPKEKQKSHHMFEAWWDNQKIYEEYYKDC